MTMTMINLAQAIAIIVVSLGSNCVSAQSSYRYIAGYEPRSDVTNHSKIGLDQKALSRAASSYDWAGAKAAYEEGGNSVKSDGSIRTIQGFSTGRSASSKSDEAYFRIMNDYWTAKGLTPYSWADGIIEAGLNAGPVGSTGFTFAASNTVTGSNDFRRDAIKKATVYLAIFPYVIWEMQDAINDCAAGELDDNTGAVHAWDEAVAFNTGYSEGIYEGGINGVETIDHFYLSYALAEKRAGNFGTATADNILNPIDVCCYSAVNANQLASFNTGKNELVVLAAGATGDASTFTCNSMYSYKNAIVKQGLVPLVQGTLRYLYKTDAKVTGGSPSNKELGELWAFATGILPLVNNVDSDVGSALYDRAWNQGTSYTFEDMKTMLEATYSGLGITCADVGSLCDTATATSAEICTPYSDGTTSWDTAACSDSAGTGGEGGGDDNHMPAFGIALIVIFAIAAIGGIFAALYMCNKSSFKPLGVNEGGQAELTGGGFSSV